MADGDVADFAVVVAACDEGDGAALHLVELDGVERKPLATLDPTRSHARLEFNDANAEPLGIPGEGWSHTQRLLDRAAVLFAWETGGRRAGCARNGGASTPWAATPLGRPIAGYQAIKHKLANVYGEEHAGTLELLLRRVGAVHGRRRTAPGSSHGTGERLSGVLLRLQENIQTHGGMGFTWEFDCQFHYRRAKLLSVNIGSEATWQDRLIAAVEAAEPAVA